MLEWTEFDIEIMTGGVKDVIYLFLFFGVHDNTVALERNAPPWSQDLKGLSVTWLHRGCNSFECHCKYW